LLFGKLHYDSIDDAVNDFMEKLDCEIDSCEYGLWGHSMGGIMAFELAISIGSLNRNKPKSVIISGNNPFHLPKIMEPLHNLSDAEFIDKIMEMGGTPPSLFEHQELKDLFLPILRRDFKLGFDYKYIGNFGIIDIPLTSVMGNQENISEVDRFRWAELTSSNCSIINLNGNHFLFMRMYANVKYH
jgi:medium-chain acyl-[acyl-carrier-protein] hydrolase